MYLADNLTRPFRTAAGQNDNWTTGQLVKLTNGQYDKLPNEQANIWTREIGQINKWKNGQM